MPPTRSKRPRSQAQRAFRPAESILAMEASALPRMWSPWSDEDDEDDEFLRFGDVAVVCIDGPLSQRGGWFFDGYESVADRISCALECEEIKAVVLKINSPGGVVAGCFETVKALRAGKTKPVYAYADECAASAAYALACVADQIWLPASGMVGSVGVVCARYDETKADEEEGVRVDVIAVGKRKTDGNPHVKVTAEELTILQDRVDTLAQLFAEQVGAARGMTPEAVLALEAGVFLGSKAVDAGLADQVGSLTECIAAASAAGQQAAPGSPAERRTMKTLFASLGLAESASEAEAIAAVAPLKEMHNALAGIAGKSDPSAIAGVIQAWKAGAEQGKEAAAKLADAEAKLADLSKAAKEAELAAVIDRGRAEGKLTKHQADNWAKSQTVEGLSAFLEHAPVVVRRDEVKAEENGGPSASVGALTPEEKAVAKTMGIPEAEMLETKRARLAAQKGALGHDRTRSCAAAEEDRRAPAPGGSRGADGGLEDLAGRDRRREQLGLRRIGEHGRRPVRPRRRRRDEGQLGGRRW